MKSGRKNKKIRGVGKEFDRVKEVCELLNKAGAKYLLVGDLPRVDLLRVAKNVKFDAAYPKREEIMFKGVRISYVCLDDLIASKQTDRLQDKADLEKLEYIKQKRMKQKS